MGEKPQEALKLEFDKRLRLEFHGARITADAGLLACRGLDGALGLTEAASIHLRETRGGRNVQVKLIKIGGRLVRHARHLVFQLTEVAVPRDLFALILKRVSGLRLTPG